MSADAPSDMDPPAPKWRVLSASVQGTRHIRAGLPCQDSVYSRADLPGGALIAAVADGAGSAPLSDIGSSLATRESVEAARLSMLHTSADVSEGYLRATAHASVLVARSALHREARKRGRSVRDFATTLILVIVAGDVLAAAQIGDGAAVVSDRSGRYFPLHHSSERRIRQRDPIPHLRERARLPRAEDRNHRPQPPRHVHRRNTEPRAGRRHPESPTRPSSRPSLTGSSPMPTGRTPPQPSKLCSSLPGSPAAPTMT